MDDNVSQIAQWIAEWHTASIIYGSNPVDAISFFIDVLHYRKYCIVVHRHLVKKVEIWFIIGDISHPVVMTLVILHK